MITCIVGTLRCYLVYGMTWRAAWYFAVAPTMRRTFEFALGQCDLASLALIYSLLPPIDHVYRPRGEPVGYGLECAAHRRLDRA